MSFLIQKSPDQRSFASFPELIAGYHVFRRFSMPRHPPCTLKSLTTFIDHRHKRPRGKLPRSVRRACGTTGPRARRKTPARAEPITDQRSPKKVLDDTRPDRPTFKAGPQTGKTKPVGERGSLPNHMAGVAEVHLACRKMNLEPRNHSLVKEQLKLARIVRHLTAPGSSDKFPAERGRVG